jgi:hypothetical protein
MSAGFPFCSLHATTQHLHPMHLVMSKWNRYCSPGPGRGGSNELEPAPHHEPIVPSASLAEVVTTKASPPDWARSSRGSSIDSSIGARFKRRVRRVRRGEGGIDLPLVAESKHASHCQLSSCLRWLQQPGSSRSQFEFALVWGSPAHGADHQRGGATVSRATSSGAIAQSISVKRIARKGKLLRCQ